MLGFATSARTFKSRIYPTNLNLTLRAMDLVLTLRRLLRPLLNVRKKRHAADYDVMIRMNKSDAVLAISTAKAALRRFDKASKARRLAYLTLLLFPPR